MKLKILSMYGGFRAIKDLQTNEKYDVFKLRIKKAGKTIGVICVDVLKDGTINFNSDEFSFVKSGDNIPLSYNAIIRKHSDVSGK